MKRSQLNASSSFERPMRANITLTPRQLLTATLAVAGGGALGTLLRDVALRVQDQHWFGALVGALSQRGHSNWWGQIPWILLLINIVGVYLATRILSGPLRNHDPNDTTRLVVITGFFGGFTSYSSLFVGLAAVAHVSRFASVGVCVAAVLSGVGAGWLGLRRRRR
jgi:CrcB protein